MKINIRNLALINCALVALVAAGCAQRQHSTYRPTTPATTTTEVEQPKPAPAPAPATARPGGYGPSYTVTEQGGLRWSQGSMAFPTGLRESSGLLVEKSVPVEVMLGQPFEYIYKVSNLTDYPLSSVTLFDHVSPNFTPSEANPKPSDLKENTATWQLGNLGPKESKTVRVRGVTKDESPISTCGWATYMPILCDDVKVVKPALQLVKRAPAEVVICDPIAMTLSVKNSGSSALTAVKVQDSLPQGLTSDDKQTLTFDAGNLAPGESKEFKFNATASAPGKFVNVAKATSSQGVEAEASATTVVRQPVLAITCKAPDQRYMGRPFDVCFNVVNKGDIASAGTVVEVAVPAGLTFRSATAGGQVSGGKVVWN
ncbi:MAG TPA: DUF11 domain-containing protein, partial [Clostridia bacterium]|nr:DUF11 domain-containing protein [Clostridia bacterium]